MRCGKPLPDFRQNLSDQTPYDFYTRNFLSKVHMTPKETNRLYLFFRVEKIKVNPHALTFPLMKNTPKKHTSLSNLSQMYYLQIKDSKQVEQNHLHENS